MDIETATADQLHGLLRAVQDRLVELAGDDRLTLAKDAEQVHGTAWRAVEQVAKHLDAARQILSRLETRD